jgi:septum site-determining protein MinC
MDKFNKNISGQDQSPISNKIKQTKIPPVIQPTMAQDLDSNEQIDESVGQDEHLVIDQATEITSSSIIDGIIFPDLDPNEQINMTIIPEKNYVNSQPQEISSPVVKKPDQLTDSELIQQINLNKKGDLVIVELPVNHKQEPNQWQRIIDNFKFRLSKMDKSWQIGTKVKIECHDRLLDTRQLNELENILEQVGLTIDVIITRRRQTAVAAASAGYSVQQKYAPITPENSLKTEITQELAEPLYLKNTIRSGMEICHPSSVIIIGDVNPGALIVANGDILVWGNLKGVAHAGATGNHQALIMALKIQPTQLRIADLVARAPENSPHDDIPEIAYISSEGIKIHVASNYYRYHYFVPQNNFWVTKNQDNVKL